MASVIKDPAGLKRVQWCVGDGDRRTLRLGKVSLRQADAVKVRVEQLLAAQSTGVLDAEAQRWAEDLGDDMHQKLARLGLVKPRERNVATLGTLLDAFFATLAVKPGTVRTYTQTRQSMEKYFGASRALESITPLDCDKWRQAMRNEKLADATVAKRVKTARQVFKQAIKWKMVVANPLADVKAGVTTNRSRMHFISRDDLAKVLAAAPDHTWRLIILLSRIGGLRVPSEIMPLTWQDIDFDKGRIHVTSCKTEGYEGGGSRVIPMFDELRAALLVAFDHAEDGAEFVISQHRLRSGNLRTRMHKIIKRAGLVPWAKPFHNMRSSRQTELAADHPIHVVCAWLGNSPSVALGHYLQVRDSDYAKAIGGVPATGGVTAEAAAGGGGGAGGTGRSVGQPAANGANVAGSVGAAA